MAVLYTATPSARHRPVDVAVYLSSDAGQLCVQSSGCGVLWVSNYRKRFFTAAVETCRAADKSFPAITAHGLRHSAASLAISAGANVRWSFKPSERVDLVDADERTLTFGAPSSVGGVRDLLVRGLVLLANESSCQLCCGRSADGCGTAQTSHRGQIHQDERQGALRFGCATAPVWWGCRLFPA
jgi:hypothetical protein